MKVNRQATTTTTSRFPEQPDFIGRLLRDLFAHQTAEVTRHIARHHPSVTAAQNRVMMMIDPDGTRPAELARRAQITRQSISEALTGLAEAGFIEMRDDPGDGRAKIAALTEDGWRALRLGLEGVLTTHARWEQLIGPTKMRRLMALLRELRDKLDAEAESIRRDI
jgi:DNA-binding MarR family transcriptional regulator